MNRTLTRVAKLVGNAAKFLYEERICQQDKVAHNGRRAYVWPLLRWLITKEEVYPKAKCDMKTVSNELFPEVKKNGEGAVVIHPGLHRRRNYSTNAIDSGIFVDAVHDLIAVHPELRDQWQNKINQVVNSYLVNKLESPTLIHNQYLWACTGLARWIEDQGLENIDKYYSELAKATVDRWLTRIHDDGFSVYSSVGHAEGLKGINTYYHSRCIAFSWYILSKIESSNDKIEKKLLRATRFLCRLYRPEGFKELTLESKRYYFRGPYEVASHPYDLFALTKAYQQTGESDWLAAAAKSLKRLLEAQSKNGELRSHSCQAGPDWQCNTMRTSHLAWLTRIPTKILSSINTQTGNSKAFWNLAKEIPSERLKLIGSNKQWTHFISQKSPAKGIDGQRCCGLILSRGENIVDLTRLDYLHYQVHSLSPSCMQRNWNKIIKTTKRVLLSTWDGFIHMNAPELGWARLKQELIDYLFVSLFTKSTAFCTEIKNTEINENQIEHQLALAALDGGDQENIGTRKIQWENKFLTVTDQLNCTRNITVRVPVGWSVNGENVTDEVLSFTGNETITYQGSLDDLNIDCLE